MYTLCIYVQGTLYAIKHVSAYEPSKMTILIPLKVFQDHYTNNQLTYDVNEVNKFKYKNPLYNGKE